MKDVRILDSILYLYDLCFIMSSWDFVCLSHNTHAQEHSVSRILCGCIYLLVLLTIMLTYHSFQSSLPICQGHSDAGTQIPTEVRMVVSIIRNHLYLYRKSLLYFAQESSHSCRPHWSGQLGIYSYTRQNSSLTFYFKITHKFINYQIFAANSMFIYICICRYQHRLLSRTTSVVDFPQRIVARVQDGWSSC